MIATTIEQSKKLIELGIDTDKADMFYASGVKLLPKNGYVIGPNIDVYAWSLNTLLDMLPVKIDNYDLVIYKSFCYNEKGHVYTVSYQLDKDFYENIYDYEIIHLKEKERPDLIDAVFDMIVWLKENNYM